MIFSFTNIITTCTYECWVTPYDVISMSSYIRDIACYVYWYVGTAAPVRAVALEPLVISKLLSMTLIKTFSFNSFHDMIASTSLCMCTIIFTTVIHSKKKT